MNYKEKADYLFTIFGEKRINTVFEIQNVLEDLLAVDDSEFTSIELGYWYNVEAEIKRQDESTDGI